MSADEREKAGDAAGDERGGVGTALMIGSWLVPLGHLAYVAMGAPSQDGELASRHLSWVGLEVLGAIFVTVVALVAHARASRRAKATIDEARGHRPTATPTTEAAAAEAAQLVRAVRGVPFILLGLWLIPLVHLVYFGTRFDPAIIYDTRGPVAHFSLIVVEVLLALVLSVLVVRSVSSTPAHVSVSSTDGTAPDPLLAAATTRALAAARRDRTIALVLTWLVPVAHFTYGVSNPHGPQSGGPLAGLVTVAVLFLTMGGECVLALVATALIVLSVRAWERSVRPRGWHGPLARDGTALGRPPTRF